MESFPSIGVQKWHLPIEKESYAVSQDYTNHPHEGCATDYIWEEDFSPVPEDKVVRRNAVCKQQLWQWKCSLRAAISFLWLTLDVDTDKQQSEPKTTQVVLDVKLLDRYLVADTIPI